MKSIYKIINKINQKVYIGKTTNTLEERFKQHLEEASRYKTCLLNEKPFNYNSRLYPAMIKHGCENFYIELIEEVNENDDINEREKYYISFYNSLDPDIGYNISPGGLGGPLFKGHHHTQQTKDLISAASKGKPQTPEFIEKRVKKNRKNIQNLNTGEIFNGIKAAQAVYKGAITYAILNEGKAVGYFWIRLDVDHAEGYTEQERKSIIKEREDRLHNSHSEAGKKGWNNKSEEDKKITISKGIESRKKTIETRTAEQKDIISKHISESLKGRKHTSETIEKLRNYYKTASSETLALRNKHNSEGQKNKKRYQNIITGKHKMFIPGTEPENWVLLTSEGGPTKGKRKYINKITGEHKMFYENEVDLNIWEKVVKDER